ncbi:MAG: SUMF1/EgtB/PvdO family nonheme iron enzyme [Rhodocyclaceae bacterium]
MNVPSFRKTFLRLRVARVLRMSAGAFALVVSAVACSQPAASTNAPTTSSDLQARIAALVEKTRKNLVFVEGGSFEMGDFGVKYGAEKLPYTSATDDDYLHKVTLDRFSIGAYKVTYAEYDVFSEATGRPKITTHSREQALRLPDVPAGVDWQQARDYCQWIGKQVGLQMDLPTEAQWEYAARNRGKFVVYPTDNGQIDPGRNAPTHEQIQDYRFKHRIERTSTPMQVGLYPPTPIGLFDMVGNGEEWVLDWYAEDYSRTAPMKNPIGPAKGTKRVWRSYGNVGADTLIHVSMTFARGSGEPKTEDSKSGISFNLHSTARCVSK